MADEHNPQHHSMQRPLIRVLPEDITPECLYSVCYKSYKAFKSVFRAWKFELDSPDFYSQRHARGAGEHLICLIQAAAPLLESQTDHKSSRNPVHRITVLNTATGKLEHLPPPPGFQNGIPLFALCVSFGTNIPVIGGWNPATWHAQRTVFIYYFVAGKWTCGSDMPTLRSFLACAASPDRKIYVAGGHDELKTALCLAKVYDFQENRSTILPEMSTGCDECQLVFVGGKFVVVTGYETENQGRFMEDCEIFDPKARKWVVIENMWSSTGGGCPRNRVGSGLHVVFCVSGDPFLQFEFEEIQWMEVGKIPGI